MGFQSFGVKITGDASSLSTALKRSATEVDALGNKIDKSNTKAVASQDKLTASAARTSGSMKQLGTFAGLAGVAIALGLGKAVSSFADFQQQMSYVQAATHDTAKQMGLLEQAAIVAGAKTVFSATEAAQAETELAKASISTKDILSGGLAGALSLASAGSLDVAQAAQIAATAMSQFGKQGKDVPHIADLLAAGANKALGEVSDLAEALKYVGPVAHGMGVSIEEATGALAEFAQKGIIGEQAGTSLRGLLLSLTSPSKQAAKEMQSLGINLYGASGNFVGLAGTAGQLQSALGKLTPQARDAALGILFGNQQVTAARVLYEGGADAVKKWTKAVNDDGYAAETARIKLNNLRGDIEQLSGSLQTELIVSGSTTNGVLRGLTQGATSTVNAFGDMPRPVQASGVAVAGVGTASLLALGAIGTLVPRVREARTALTEMGTAGEFANRSLGRLGRLGAYGAILAGVGLGLSALGNKIDELTHNAPPKVDVLTASLVRLGQTGRTTGAALDLIGHGAGQLKDDLSTLDGLSGTIGHLASASSFGLADREWVRAKNRVDALDKALASLVQQGYASQAKEILSVVAAGVVARGGDAADLKRKLDDYRAALAGADTQQALTGQSATSLGDSIDTVSPAAQQATDALEGYKKSLDDLNNVSITAARARIAEREALAAAGKAVDKDASKVTDKETSSLLDLADQANQTAAAIIDQTGSQKKANTALHEARQGFIDVAQQMGYSRRKAKELADAWLQIPRHLSTDYTAHGLADAASTAARLRRQLLGIPSHVSTSVTIGTANKLANGPSFYGGGAVRGPGTGTSDSILARVSTGEHVMTAAEVAAAGGHSAVEAMRRSLLAFKSPWAGIPGYAGGGPVGWSATQAAAAAAGGVRVVYVKVPQQVSETHTHSQPIYIDKVEGNVPEILSEVDRRMRANHDMQSSPSRMGARFPGL